MARLFVNIATGPENATRAALGLLVAKTAASEGHEVRVFFAGDGVHLLNPETAESVQGLGTGAAAEHLRSLREQGIELFASKMSSEARGIGEPEGVQLAPPQKLVELAAWSDTALTY